jgi:hypothetical protein
MLSIDLSNPCTGDKAAVENTSKPIVVEMDGKYLSLYICCQ